MWCIRAGNAISLNIRNPYNQRHGKNSAHYPLETVKALVLARGFNAFTQSASDNARLMGLDRMAAVAVVLGFWSAACYSIACPSHVDHRVWQDVYHEPCPNGKTACMKVTIQADAIVIQFKEK